MECFGIMINRFWCCLILFVFNPLLFFYHCLCSICYRSIKVMTCQHLWGDMEDTWMRRLPRTQKWDMTSADSKEGKLNLYTTCLSVYMYMYIHCQGCHKVFKYMWVADNFCQLLERTLHGECVILLSDYSWQSLLICFKYSVLTLIIIHCSV